MEHVQEREYSGRRFSQEDLELIQEIVVTYRNLSQSELSATVCELIGWVQPNGKPKTVQCAAFLRILADEGMIDLPALNAVKQKAASTRKRAESEPTDAVDTETIPKPIVSQPDITEITGKIRLDVVHPGEDLRRWREHMRLYHALGDPKVFGCQIRYSIKSEDGRELGCLLFSASSWTLGPRDEWIGWNQTARKERLQLVVNNSRFLVFPWVRVKNLASRALSAAAKRVQRDWLDEYCFAPVLLETFVDISQFQGTCYKAANWMFLGETQGRGRNDRYKERALTRKAIYMYPLQRDFRQILQGEKPWKTVEPHI